MTERTGEPVLTAEEWDRLLDYLEVNAPADVDDVIAVLEVRAHRAEKPVLTPSQPVQSGLRDFERFAANAILDRPNADPDDDAAIVARAAIRLAATPSQPVPSGLAERLHALGIGCLEAVVDGVPVNPDDDRRTHEYDAARLTHPVEGSTESGEDR